MKTSFLIGLWLLLPACTSVESQTPVDPVPSTTQEKAAKAPSKETPRKNPIPQSACIGFDPNTALPLWQKKDGYVITKLTKTCTTPAGAAGYEPLSPWIAMAFPCAGGMGKIDIRGNQWSPKQVSLVLATDCPMGLRATDIEPKGQKALGLMAQGKLLALNPFAVQFWEIPGLLDSDTGFSIELRSPQALQQTWTKFQAGTPITVRLYGRENSWVSNHQLYEVNADLVKSGQNQFKLQVIDLKALGPKEIEEVRQRCWKFKSNRSCDSIL